MVGDCYETLIYTDEIGVLEYLQKQLLTDEIITYKGVDTSFIELKGQKFLDDEVSRELSSKFKISAIKECGCTLTGE